MIARLTGKVAEKQPPIVVLDVNGVGYELNMSLYSCLALPETGASATVHTHLVVREDAQLLFGFADQEEKTLFRELIKVNGVGPKMALGILSALTPNEFAGAVQRNDISGLTKIPGVGKKTAERLAIEMRDRLAGWQSANINSAPATTTKPVASDWDREAESALIALGYKPQDATRLISQARKACEGDGMAIDDSQVLIRQALKLLGSR